MLSFFSMRASDVPKLLVMLGDHNINSKSDAITTDVGVANIIKHKGFSQRTLHNDVAILKLSSSVTYSKTVRPVCMASYGANVPGDTLATVVGWGMLSHVGPRPDILQEITFKTWGNQRCSSTYGSNAPGGITDHMLCAGQKGQDSCMVKDYVHYLYFNMNIKCVIHTFNTGIYSNFKITPNFGCYCYFLGRQWWSDGSRKR